MSGSAPIADMMMRSSGTTRGARLISQESRLKPDALGPVTRSGQAGAGNRAFMRATAAERFLSL
jgi:hypothetical protein